MKPFIGFLPDISEYNVIPSEKLDIPKRVPQRLKKIDFEAIVKNEKNRKRNDTGTDLPFGIPTFEEFVTNNADKESITNGFEEMHLADLSDNTNPVEESIFSEMIAEIDKEIEVLEEKQRKKKEKKIATVGVTITKVSSFKKTASIIADCIGVSNETGNFILQKALSDGNGLIKGTPVDELPNLIKKLSRVGTIAVQEEGMD